MRRGRGLAHDLIRWEPVLDGSGELLPIARPRPGRFDSALVEPGPPALLTGDGSVLLYDGKNAEGEAGGPALAAGSHSGGQILFDRSEPTKVLARLDRPFFQPERAWEREGQYAAGTTFLEGLALFEGRWFLYTAAPTRWSASRGLGVNGGRKKGEQSRTRTRPLPDGVGWGRAGRESRRPGARAESWGGPQRWRLAPEIERCRMASDRSMGALWL